ncbi:MAG: phosphotransferase [Anaerolineae bacterium]|nr:phosphotransferase [Anaerolineae bacterium]
MPSISIPTKHSILDEDALGAWLVSQYALNGAATCRFFRQSMSDVYLVESTGATFFFKVYMHGRHTRNEIEAELEFLDDLRSHHIAVASPIENGRGGYLNAFDAPEGTRYGILFAAATGIEPQETNPQHSRQFGRLAARIHRCADERGKPYRRWHLDETRLIRDPIAGMRPYLGHRMADWADLSQFGEELIAELHALLPKTAPEYGVCHGDLHAGNARFDARGELVLFDLDSFGYGWRALDIGVYVVSTDWLDLSREGKAAKARVLDAFLEGYHEERTLTRDELAAVQLAMPIRHLELMGLTMRYWTQHQGIHWISDDYFDQHISWFKEWANVYRAY